MSQEAGLPLTLFSDVRKEEKMRAIKGEIEMYFEHFGNVCNKCKIRGRWWKNRNGRIEDLKLFLFFHYILFSMNTTSKGSLNDYVHQQWSITTVIITLFIPCNRVKQMTINNKNTHQMTVSMTRENTHQTSRQRKSKWSTAMRKLEKMRTGSRIRYLSPQNRPWKTVEMKRISGK